MTNTLREIAEFRGQIHRAENRLIHGIDKARQAAGTNGIGKAFGLRPRGDWRLELAIGVGRKMMERQKSGYANVNTNP